METVELLHQVMHLKPADKFLVIERLISSLDEPDKYVDELWALEAEKRLVAYRQGNIRGVPMNVVFNE